MVEKTKELVDTLQWEEFFEKGNFYGLIVDGDYNIVRINKKMKDLPIKIPKKWYDCFKERYPPKICAIKKLSRGEETKTTFYHPGLKKWFIEQASKITARDVTYYLITLMDLSDKFEPPNPKEKEQEEALKFRLEYEQILSQILNDLVSQPLEGLEKIITTALKRITPFIEATCGFIIQISRCRNIITKTHQWCDEPVATPIDLFESIPASYFEQYLDRLTKNETIIVRDPEDIPPKAHAAAKWMQKLGFRSQLLIPMISNREVIGILGFISQIEKPVHWKTKKILLMKFLANVFVTALEQKQTLDTLRIRRELTMAVKSTYSITETIEQFLESATQLESIDFAVAYLYDPYKKTYHLTEQKGFSDEFISSMQDLKKTSSLGRLITAGKPVYSLFSALVPENVQKIHTTPQALAILPISYEKQILGSLFFASKSLSDFPDVERTILESAAFQLGNVITRIQAISALKQREKSSRITNEKKI